MWLFYYFNFETNYDVLKSKGSCILLNKNIDFKKNKTKSKLENPTYSLREEKTFCFSSYKNRKLKVKLWWEGIFCTVYFARKRSFTIFVLSQCIVYWIHLQNIHTFTYQKTLFHTLLLLVLKIAESLHIIVSLIELMKTFKQLQSNWIENNHSRLIYVLHIFHAVYIMEPW